MALDDGSQTTHLADDKTLWPRHTWPDDAVVFRVVSEPPFFVCTFDGMRGDPMVFNARPP